ncbi:Got1/Sft2-like family-domain-containing protein [Pelagophyceae sp. CCMP2097]|nr:Got1/Sft2-like family-domain-containing protein [Pelagophyceae sp. CCMP2097]
MAAAPAEWDWRSNLDSALELTKARFDEASKRSLELAEDARLRSLELAAATSTNANAFGESLKSFSGTGLTNLGAPVALPAPEKKSDEAPPAAPPDSPAQNSGWTGAAFWSSFATPENETNGAPAGQPLEEGDIESRESLLGGFDVSTLASRVGEGGRGFVGFATKLGVDGKVLAARFNSTVSTTVVDSRECGLSRAQRFRWYVILLMISTSFFIMALNFLPLVILKPAKFATAFAIGTVSSIAAKAMLNGPCTQLRLMFAYRKLPYTLSLLVSTALVLWASLGAGNFVLTLVFSGAQVTSLLYYLFGDTPGGKQGIMLLGRVVWNTMKLIARPCLSALSE